MNLNCRHQKRWNAAKRLFTNLKEKAKFCNAQLMFDGELGNADHITIGDDIISYRASPGITYILFEANPDYDHGLHTSIEDFRTEMRERFKLVKHIRW